MPAYKNGNLVCIKGTLKGCILESKEGNFVLRIEATSEPIKGYFNILKTKGGWELVKVLRSVV